MNVDIKISNTARNAFDKIRRFCIFVKDVLFLSMRQNNIDMWGNYQHFYHSQILILKALTIRNNHSFLKNILFLYFLLYFSNH